eukprot:s29_g6.t1
MVRDLFESAMALLATVLDERSVCNCYAHSIRMLLSAAKDYFSWRLDRLVSAAAKMKMSLTHKMRSSLDQLIMWKARALLKSQPTGIADPCKSSDDTRPSPISTKLQARGAHILS